MRIVELLTTESRKREFFCLLWFLTKKKLYLAWLVSQTCWELFQLTKNTRSSRSSNRYRRSCYIMRPTSAQCSRTSRACCLILRPTSAQCSRTSRACCLILRPTNFFRSMVTETGKHASRIDQIHIFKFGQIIREFNVICDSGLYGVEKTECTAAISVVVSHKGFEF